VGGEPVRRHGLREDGRGRARDRFPVPPATIPRDRRDGSWAVRRVR
jgi:hypothetical protein